MKLTTAYVIFSVPVAAVVAHKMGYCEATRGVKDGMLFLSMALAAIGLGYRLLFFKYNKIFPFDVFVYTFAAIITSFGFALPNDGLSLMEILGMPFSVYIVKKALEIMLSCMEEEENQNQIKKITLMLAMNMAMLFMAA